MAVEKLPGWRKTGRKAPDDHWRGLNAMTLLEFPGYDNRGDQQGKILACLTNKEEPIHIQGGEVFMGQILAVEDGYYDYWLTETHGTYTTSRVIPLHFCERPTLRCNSQTKYREPIHVDVFRIIPVELLHKIQWLTEADMKRIQDDPLVVGLRADAGAGDPPAPVATPKSGAKKAEVALGQEGLEGLAAALGDQEDRPAKRKKEEKASSSGEDRKERDEDRKARKRSRSEGRKRKKEKVSDEGELRKAIEEKRPQEPRLSALDLGSLSTKEKKKKKEKKSKKDRKDEEDRGYSPSTSSSTDELFRSAALPRGLERLRRVHQRHPGKIASLSLLRLQELVHMTQGRGTAPDMDKNPLPAVAMSYVTQVFFGKFPMGEVTLRTARELKTVARVIDLLCSNDPLRALDILLQRLKALELSHEQGNWAQAAQLELVLPDQTSAVFRQEIRAAQAELKTTWELEAGPSRYQRWKGPSWRPQPAEGGVHTETKESGAKDEDRPPNNNQRSGGKSRGKGKKGKGKRRW